MQYFEWKSLKYNFQNFIFDVDKKYISDMERADNLNLLTMGEMR